MSNVFCFFINFHNFVKKCHFILCIKTKKPIFFPFFLFFMGFCFNVFVFFTYYSPFVAGATCFSEGFHLLLLYNLYISSAANRVLATKSPAFRGKQ